MSTQYTQCLLKDIRIRQLEFRASNLSIFKEIKYEPLQFSGYLKQPQYPLHLGRSS